MKAGNPVRLQKARREETRAPRVLESILTTTDFSSESMHGVKYGAADILLLHVVPTPPSWSGMGPIIPDVSAVAEWAREHLLKVILRQFKAFTTVRGCVVIGNPQNRVTIGDHIKLANSVLRVRDVSLRKYSYCASNRDRYRGPE